MKPPKDEIKISYKPEKTKQNYTEIFNAGSSQINYAFVYYDYDRAELQQKGWFAMAPNTKEYQLFDVYYIYAYEIDLYGDYVRLTGENHFDIPMDVFEGAADPCEPGEGTAFKQWFNGESVPAKDPPKDMINISYKPEEFVQNSTFLSNNGGGQLEVAIIYYDWVKKELCLKSWIQIEPGEFPEVPYDVVAVHAFEKDDRKKEHTVMSGKKYYFQAFWEDEEDLAKVVKKGDTYARGFELTCKGAGDLIKASLLARQFSGADQLLSKLGQKTFSDIPKDIINIENKTVLEKERKKLAKAERKRKKGDNNTRIHNSGGGRLQCAIVYYNEKEKQLYQKGWFFIRAHAYLDIPYDPYYIYAHADDPDEKLYYFTLKDDHENFFQIPHGAFDEPAVRCAKGKSRLMYGFQKNFKGDKIPAKKPPKNEIYSNYMTKGEQAIAQTQREEEQRQARARLEKSQKEMDDYIAGGGLMGAVNKGMDKDLERQKKSAAKAEKEYKARKAEEERENQERKRRQEKKRQEEERQKQEEIRKKQEQKKLLAEKKKADKARRERNALRDQIEDAKSRPNPASNDEVWVRNLSDEQIEFVICWGVSFAGSGGTDGIGFSLGGTNYYSSGWYCVDPGEDWRVLTGAAKNKTHYWYAKSDSYKWQGESGDSRNKFKINPKLDDFKYNNSVSGHDEKSKGIVEVHFNELKTDGQGRLLIKVRQNNMD